MTAPLPLHLKDLEHRAAVLQLSLLHIFRCGLSDRRSVCVTWMARICGP